MNLLQMDDKKGRGIVVFNKETSLHEVNKIPIRIYPNAGKKMTLVDQDKHVINDLLGKTVLYISYLGKVANLLKIYENGK